MFSVSCVFGKSSKIVCWHNLPQRVVTSMKICHCRTERGEGQFLKHPRSSIFSHSHNSLTSCAYSETKTFLTTIMRNSQALKKNMASKAKLKIFRNSQVKYLSFAFKNNCNLPQTPEKLARFFALPNDYTHRYSKSILLKALQ